MAGVVCVGLYLAVLLLHRQKSATTIVTGLLMATAGWILARLHLWIVDPAYLAAGRLQEDSYSADPRPRFSAAFLRVIALCLFVAGSVMLYGFINSHVEGINSHIEYRQTAAWATRSIDRQDFTAALLEWNLAERYARSSINKQDEIGALRGRAYVELRLSRWSDALRDYDAVGIANLTLTDLRGKAWALRETGQLERRACSISRFSRATPVIPEPPLI